MNEILTLTGKRFEQRKSNGIPMGVNVPTGAIIKLIHIKNLYAELQKIQSFWNNEHVINGALINVQYYKLVAKSNRASAFFKNGKHVPNETVVGARFNEQKNKHIITHFVSMDVLKKTIEKLNEVIKIFENEIAGESLSKEEFEDRSAFDTINFSQYTVKVTEFKHFLKDSCFIEKLFVDMQVNNISGTSIVTLYDVNLDLKNMLSKLGIHISSDRIMNKTTVLLDEQYVKILFDKAPYLVSMAVKDINQMAPYKSMPLSNDGLFHLPSPKDEPTIGVLDTLFDPKVLFSEWVEFHDEISDQISKNPIDYRHGTSVSSLIVAAPDLNPNLDDGCGHFKVRHFGVALAKGFNSFEIIRKISHILETNSDIKVWNLSLGSNDEIRDNFISAEGSILDELQYKYDVIFIIAGTNQVNVHKELQKIGAPADSLNSIVVNSVDFSKKSANYSRQGIVLSFFTKPDVSYYGGGNGDFIKVIEPLGLADVTGTSYAAPLISRKVAYLIHVMGLSREVAKALIIDSAIGWNQNKSFNELALIGHGIVPISISEVLETPEDEIKFMISDVSEKYDSYNYNFPVPIKDSAFPYIAKATMVYFPKTSRSQGVDYTNTELNIKFGRLKDVAKGDPIDPINSDHQNVDDGKPHYLYEENARKLFQKWDNVKHIGEKYSQRKQVKSILNNHNPQWGMSVKTTERLASRDGEGVRFGVVVTLKAIDGVNRIEEFINSAYLRGWLVTRLQVENQIVLFNKLNEEVELD
ncbi:S8 family peptidase [Leuconostoc mesenteroides]|uniref:Subtilisin-like serine protease n=1 Tax=Leuconostoc mesenteroides subsp. mesenteroides (strain ATCC 8293 / DSM 20343 / BCRC 11652 / CCM 1803 / JCM 6124 / NCDO 523 / NBRC 100496 / NCIMB 8023 / NCTC 12954 / NRRL B-1118 / 37Y) TaxID=203120 RepID=Q03WS3_LEUMM|nr:S8 family peptidase [Leuconostoc mesenteroides]ABJ62349.1 Subtilisin-like serine protease [Leuconostoc mesenteroides subsp. mesenteroides ATCC 8293]MCT3042716.1 serine protease [Leuconostoc mesenteroides]MCT3045407.1 serine protease [Leuconostoc mesenteroides]MDG9747238.1 S8 family peptidase [Leuconostoc mesenteroides]QQB30865.1 S8 family peptidase [Leuconostoc mesenteroides]